MTAIEVVVQMIRSLVRRGRGLAVRVEPEDPPFAPEPLRRRRLFARSTPPVASLLGLPAIGPVTSPFGMRVHPIRKTRRLHAGVDIGAPRGSAVHAAGDGVVVSAGPQHGYGLTVVIDHGDGQQTLYAHLDGIDVRPGERLRTGDALGSVGATGAVTGAHLHFERRFNGRPVDPGLR